MRLSCMAVAYVQSRSDRKALVVKRFFMRQRLSKIAQGFRPAFGKSKQDMKADAAALAVSPRTPTVLELANETDSLLAFEINNGCMGPVEQLLDELRKTILENRVAYVAVNRRKRSRRPAYGSTC